MENDIKNKWRKEREIYIEETAAADRKLVQISMVVGNAKDEQP